MAKVTKEEKDLLDTVPKNAKANMPITVTLCGVDYQFREPMRRRSDYLLGRAGKIMLLHGINSQLEIEGSQDTRNAYGAAVFKESSGDVLDWLYDALEVPRTQQRIVEKKYTTQDLSDAWTVILEFLRRPFVGSTSSAANANGEKPDSDAASQNQSKTKAENGKPPTSSPENVDSTGTT